MTRRTVRELLWGSAILFGPSQPDGFGFALYGPSGASAWGRYRSPDAFKGFCESGAGCQEGGSIPATTTLLMVHGRTSTNERGLANAHPFRTGPRGRQRFLVHNGVLRWAGQGRDPNAAVACDSDRFARWYEAGGTPKLAAESWSGYGAIGLLDTDPASAGMTVLKCPTVSLYAAIFPHDGPATILSTIPSDAIVMARQAGHSQTGTTKMPASVCRYGPDGRLVAYEEWGGFRSMAWGWEVEQSIGVTAPAPKPSRRGRARLKPAREFVEQDAFPFYAYR